MKKIKLPKIPKKPGYYWGKSAYDNKWQLTLVSNSSGYGPRLWFMCWDISSDTNDKYTKFVPANLMTPDGKKYI